MVQINFAQKEIQCKIVYYGPGMSGKTTNLEVVHKKAPNPSKGELIPVTRPGSIVASLRSTRCFVAPKVMSTISVIPNRNSR